MTARTMREIDAEFYATVIDEFDRMRGDLKTTSDVLMDFAGKHVWQQAQNAVDHIDWLKRELALSQYNEKAARRVAEVNAHEVEGLKRLLARGGFHVEEARQESGSSGSQQEREG